MQHSVPRLSPWSFATLAVLASAACFTSSTTEEATVYDTTVSIDPKAFAASVLCAQSPGAWQTYVATLFDVTDTARPFQLASSPPLACSLAVTFKAVLPEHSYVALIDAYDRSDIVAYGAPNSGSRHMVDPKTGKDVYPRWTSRCPASWGSDAPTEEGGAAADSGTSAEDSGVGPSIPGAVVSSSNLEAQLLSCSALEEILPPLPTAIAVDLKSVRAQKQCGKAVDQVDHFEVIPTGSVHSPQEATCDATVVFSPVSEGLTYHLRVEAFSQGAKVARWATNCSAVPREGVTISATCDSLTDEGVLRIDLASLLADAGHSCGPSDTVRYRAVLAGSNDPLEADCATDALFHPLVQGSYEVILETLDANNAVQLSAWCRAEVVPATTTTAACTVQ